ncbi:hypothetical protein AcW1_003929 [Taiwanofungus camphoratus]|nr:hypothetical protein AcW1_003929 [Antrodia cinnamomea]
MAIAVRRMFVSPGGNKWGAYVGWSRAREYKEGRGRQDIISPARPPAQTQSILAFATQPNHPGTMLGFSKVLSLAAVALAAAHGAYAQAPNVTVTSTYTDWVTAYWTVTDVICAAPTATPYYTWPPYPPPPFASGWPGLPRDD